MSRYGLRNNVGAVISNGVEPTRRAVDVLRTHRKLAVFPALSLLGTLFVGVGFFLSYRSLGRPIWYEFVSLGVGPWAAGGPTAYVLVFIFITGFAAVVFFSNAGLVYCTKQVVDGESPSVRAGFRAAAGVLPQVFVYAVVTGAAGVVVAFLERRTDWFAGVVAGVLRMSYVMLTFFAVPAAVLDGASPAGMFRLSARTIRSHLGGRATVYLGVTLLIANAFMIPLYVGIVLVTVNGAFGVVEYPALVEWGAGVFGVSSQRAETLGTVVGYVLMVLPMWVGFVLGSSLSAIAKTSLYVAIHEDSASLPLFDIDREDALVIPEYST